MKHWLDRFTCFWGGHLWMYRDHHEGHDVRICAKCNLMEVHGVDGWTEVP
jgi:hypothetical protein